MRLSRPGIVLVCFAALLASQPSAATDRAACEKVKQQIREIEARMRNGYTAAQGIRLEARLRKLKDKRYKLCR